MHNYHQVLKQYGFLPEFYNVAQGGASAKREGYPLRPELIESAVYLYRATKDPWLLSLGEDILTSIETVTKTECGYATVKNVKDHTLDNRMESFFLAETIKYLYLLFTPDHWLLKETKGKKVKTSEGTCIVNVGGYVFNTEAHPIDPAALECCSGHAVLEDVRKKLAEDSLNLARIIEQHGDEFQEFRGDSLPKRIQEIEERRKAEVEANRLRRKKHEEMMEETRRKQREAIKRRKELEELRKKKLEEFEKMVEDEQDQNEDPEKAFVKHVVEGNNVDDHDVTEEDEETLKGEDEVEDEDEEALEVISSEEESAIEEDKVQSKGEVEEVVLVYPDENEETFKGQEGESDGNDSVAEIGSIEPKLFDWGEPTTKTNATNGTKINVVETLTKMITNILPIPAKKKVFDLDEFRDRLLRAKNARINRLENENWYTDFISMTCPAKSFLQRFAIRGEFTLM